MVSPLTKPVPSKARNSGCIPDFEAIRVLLERSKRKEKHTRLGGWYAKYLDSVILWPFSFRPLVAHTILTSLACSFCQHSHYILPLSHRSNRHLKALWSPWITRVLLIGSLHVTSLFSSLDRWGTVRSLDLILRLVGRLEEKLPLHRRQGISTFFLTRLHTPWLGNVLIFSCVNMIDYCPSEYVYMYTKITCDFVLLT